jgi:hypothetical protein
MDGKVSGILQGGFDLIGIEMLQKIRVTFTEYFVSLS